MLGAHKKNPIPQGVGFRALHQEEGQATLKRSGSLLKIPEIEIDHAARLARGEAAAADAADAVFPAATMLASANSTTCFAALLT